MTATELREALIESPARARLVRLSGQRVGLVIVWHRVTAGALRIGGVTFVYGLN